MKGGVGLFLQFYCLPVLAVVFAVLGFLVVVFFYLWCGGCC